MSKEIYLAGGCFWGVEAYFKALKGVISTEAGYANGNFQNPSYQDLIKGSATHAEAVLVVYEMISLKDLLAHFFRFVDPFSLNKQGADIGIQYRSGIYYTDIEDLPVILEVIKELEEKHQRKSFVEVLPLDNYYPAEMYHQDYLTKNPNGYCHVDLTLLKKEERKWKEMTILIGTNTLWV